MENHVNPWKKISGKRLYENPWMSVEEHRVINPTGSESQYGVVSFKNKAVGIIPLDEQLNTWLVGQFRYTLNEYSWEIPMGGGPAHEDPLTSAQRELREETGITAGKWTNIMRIHTSNSVTDEEGFVFLAEDLQYGETDFDETEDLEIKKMPLKEAIQWVMDGKITDAITAAGLLKAARLMNL